MFKRLLLTFTFVAALGAAGLGIGSKAMAWNDCNTGVAYPVPTYAAYPGYLTYAAPRVAYYPTAVRTYPVFYGRVSDGHHRHHDDHHHSGVSISFGF